MNLAGLKNSVAGRLVVKFNEDRAINWATLIAWSALLAMFPILIFMASILGYTLRIAHVDTNQLFDKFASAFPGGGYEDIRSGLHTVQGKAGIFAIVGLVGLMFGGSALIGTMEQAFAVIYHTRPRSFIRRRLVAFGMILLFTALGGLVVLTSSVLPALKSLDFVPVFLTSGPAAWLIQVVLGVASGFLLFLSVYFVVPNRRQEVAKVWPGALLAGVLFEAVTLVFPFYLEVNKGIGNYGKTFALFFTLMTFFYFLGIVTMAGVELNSVIYPVPVEQPGTVEGLDTPGGKPSDVARRPPTGRSGPRPVILLGIGAIGWALGVATGKRARQA